MNPNYQNVSAITPGNPQNDAGTRVMRTHNTFPMSYQHALTCRFGDETPFYVFDSESNDKVPFSSFHELRSYTLSSQFLDKLNMHKTYFSVPYKAIMPNTWDLFYVPPTQGDDVPDNVSPVLDNPLPKLDKVFYNLKSSIASPLPNWSALVSTLKYYYLLEMFFSDGSLLSYMGCKLGKYFTDSLLFKPAFERFSEYFLGQVYSLLSSFLDEPGKRVTFSSESGGSFDFTHRDLEDDSLNRITFRSFLEWSRDNSDFKLAYSSEELSYSFDELPDSFVINSSVNIPINLSRCCAYQLAYFHFLTNDKVDFIYSADLYRNTMLSHAKNALNEVRSFEYNGNSYFYDWCSGYYLNEILYLSGDMPSLFDYFYIYFAEILSIRKSLKFGDYFTGSRPHPYAVGDMTAPVVGNGVSAVDMTRNIMAQRFLNAVNKTGRKLSEYMKGIRGADTMPLLTDPKFLARDTTSIGTMEVENTSSDQGKVVSLLRAEQSKYAFEADIEDPCIILGLVSFSVPRMYCRTIDRFFFKKIREDYFNPYYQNIGDQEIYSAEKITGGLTPFSYTLRNMEYKQRYPIASGGVVDYLPSWFFVADNANGEDEKYVNLNPDFIRSHNTEFDRFYSSLTGYTLCSYFHFIIRFVNESSPNRNMEYSPTIL